LFPSGFFDAIITSPPYYDVINYAQNDAHSLDFLNVNIQKLAQMITGLHGSTKKEKKILFFSLSLMKF